MIRRYRDPVFCGVKQRVIADRAGPWTRPDYQTSAVAKETDRAWKKASRWSEEDWYRRNPKSRVRTRAQAPEGIKA